MVLIEPHERLDANVALLTGRKFQHLRDVLRVEVGQTVRCGLLNGCLGEGEVIHRTATQIRLRLQLEEAPPAPLDIPLVLGLPRPHNLGPKLQSLVNLGVKRVDLIHSFRVQKAFWQSDELLESSLHRYVVRGLEQACDTVEPDIRQYRFFKPYIEDILPNFLKSGQLQLIAHPYVSRQAPWNVRESLCLAVGPEGGWIDYEVEQFQNLGFEPIQLGQRILKLDVALLTLIGRLKTL